MRTADLAILAGAIQIGFVCAILLWSSLLFLAGVPISWFHVPLAALSAGVFGWWVATELFPQERARLFALTLGGSALAFCLFLLLEGNLYDVSWDGQAYQTEAILQLADGWNPIRDGLPSGLDWATYLTFWPKGAWICAATIYKLTGNMEAGKAFHLLLMTACWLCAFAGVSSVRGITTRWALVGCSLLAFNPISLPQMHTYYVDGLLLSLMTIAVSLLILIDRCRSRVLMVLLACVVILTMNVKLSAPVYLGILLGGRWIWYALGGKGRRLDLAASLVGGGIVGGVFVGFNPFVSEFIGRLWKEGYRFLLSDWISLLTIQRESPLNFRSMNRFMQLLLSLFSKSDVAGGGDPSQLKVPFTVSISEIRAFSAPDVRVGGFGPLFGGALLLAVAVLVVLIIRYRRDLLTNNLIVLSALTTLSAFPNQEMWWARFAPQLWLSSILVLMAGLSVMPKRARWLPFVFGGTMILNVAILYFPNALAQYGGSQQVASQLADLKRQPLPLTVTFNRFAATRYRFNQQGIRYVEVATLPCSQKNRVRLERSEAVFCRQLPPR